MKGTKMKDSKKLEPLNSRSIIILRNQITGIKWFTFLVFLLLTTQQTFSQTNDDCLTCHNDPDLSKIRAGKKVSLYVKPEALNNSVHSSLECTFCHSEAAVSEFPHPETLAPVNCGDCHDVAMTDFLGGIHGDAFSKNDKN